MSGFGWKGSDMWGWEEPQRMEERAEGRTDSTEMGRKVRKKKAKEHKHSSWFLSRSQSEMNAPDFSL